MNRRVLLILVLIIALGALLRLYNLNSKPLCFDEASNVINALKDPELMLRPPYNYKPMHFYLLKMWLNIFGIDAFPGRLLSVLLGLASLAFVFRIGKKLFCVRTGLIASLLLSVSVFHIKHCQQIGPESLLLFLTTVSFDTFLSYFLNRKKLYLGINLLSNILIIFVYPMGILIILSQLIFVTGNLRSFEKISVKKWLLSFSALVFVTAVLVFILSREEMYFKSVLWWARPPLFGNIIETFATFSYGGPRYGLEDVGILTCPFKIACALVLLFFIFFIRGMFKIIRWKAFNHKRYHYLVIIWFFLPLVAVFVFSHIFFPVYFIRKLLFILPAFYLIVAAGINFKSIKLSFLFLISIVLLNIPAYNIMYNSDYNVDWKKVVLLIRENNIKEGSTIIISTCKEIAPFMYYFSRANKEDLKDISMFGRLLDGEWQDEFSYQKYRFICLLSEYYKIPRINPGRSSEHNNYTCEYFNGDLDEKFFNTGYPEEHKPVWLLISRWTGLSDSCLNEEIDKFRRIFDLRLKTEVGGVKVFYFE